MYCCYKSAQGSAGLFFFCQAEDGIRAHCVTGVQTCALPITRPHLCPSPGTCPGGSPDPGCGGGTGVQVPSRNWFLPWHKKPWPHCALPEHPVWQTPPKQVRREVGQSRFVLHFSSRHSPPNKPG